MDRRAIDILVLSDIHLGTYGCHAKELLAYLKSVKPSKIVLNGDIIDIWNLRKRYFPKEHLQVLKQLINFIANDVEVYYLTGNHDEFLRKFTDVKMGNFQLLNKLVLTVEEKRIWFFHGDVFDASIQYSKFLAKLGGKGYDLLILFNRLINKGLKFIGKPPASISKSVKNGVKRAIKFVSDFEQTAIKLAMDNDYVICGHIHSPKKIRHFHKGKKVTYLNSGDWVENLSALEYYDSAWHIYKYHQPYLNAAVSDEGKIVLLPLKKEKSRVVSSKIQ